MNSDEYSDAYKSYSCKRDAFKDGCDEGYNEGVEEVHARVRKNFIRAVHEGTMPLQEAINLGFDIREEMLQRGISIPDQDIVGIRFYKDFVERITLSRGTKELLKIYTKDDIVIFFKQAKQFDKRPIEYVKRIIAGVQSDERYMNDNYYRKCLDAVRAEYREAIIECVHDGEMSLILAHKLGFDVKDEMLQRGISIPDQDLQNLAFYRNQINRTILDRGIKELLKIFTPSEVADYLELIRVKSSEDVYEDEKGFLESIIRAINVMETARKHSEERAASAAHGEHASSKYKTVESNNDNDDDNDEDNDNDDDEEE